MMPFAVIPARILASTSRMRFSDRFEPIARRNSSASPPLKSGDRHRHRQQLLLKQWNAECALQYRFKRGMHVVGLFEPHAAPQIGIHHFADDGSGPDDSDLNDDVVELLRLHAGQNRHLRAAFHLKQPDRVRFLQRGVNRRDRLRGRCARPTFSP